MFSYFAPTSYSPFSSPRHAYYPSMSIDDQYRLAIAQEQERRRQAAREARQRQAYLDEMAMYQGRHRRQPAYSWFEDDEEDDVDEYANYMQQLRKQQQRQRESARTAQRTPRVARSIPIVVPLGSEQESYHRPSRSPQHSPKSSPTHIKIVPAPNTTPSSVPDYNAAATTIQSHWRTHQSRSKALRAISLIRSKFDTLRDAFIFPRSLDFTTTTDITNTQLPKLEYTHNNRPLHAYEHALTLLLVELDGVQSGGDPIVREARKALVKDVEEDLAGLDMAKMNIWEEIQAQARAHENAKEADSMEGLESELERDELEVALTTALPDSDDEMEEF